MTTNDAIVFSLKVSKDLMRRFVEDLRPEEYLHRPAPKANCVAWLLGHLTLTERRALAALGAGEMPALPDGFEKRFARDETAPGAADFGDVMPLLQIWEQHRQMLIDKVATATAEQLDRPLDKAHPRFSKVGEMAAFMAQHAILHTGQISTIRRSLGKPPVM
jgi:uncharacterized damage-inducible protein DinB